MPLLCTCLNSLNFATDRLRYGIIDYHQGETDDFHSLGVKTQLLRDYIGAEPGITSVPLRSAWEGVIS